MGVIADHQRRSAAVKVSASTSLPMQRTVVAVGSRARMDIDVIPLIKTRGSVAVSATAIVEVARRVTTLEGALGVTVRLMATACQVKHAQGCQDIITVSIEVCLVSSVLVCVQICALIT